MSKAMTILLLCTMLPGQHRHLHPHRNLHPHHQHHLHHHHHHIQHVIVIFRFKISAATSVSKNVKTGLVSTYISDSSIKRVLDISEIQSVSLQSTLNWKLFIVVIVFKLRWGGGEGASSKEEWGSWPCHKVNSKIFWKNITSWDITVRQQT